LSPEDAEELQGEYWRKLEPIVYENAEAARDVTFKQFMTTHVRKYLPGVYK
jgi:hypothetical protein